MQLYGAQFFIGSGTGVVSLRPLDGRSRELNDANTITTPSYSVVDGGVRRRLTDRVAVDVRFYNLFDEFYAHNIYGGAAAPQWLIGRPPAAEVALTAAF